MPLLGNVRTSLWIVLLISTNILTGLFVFLHLSTGDLCRVYSGMDNYYDTNPLYHNFDVESVKRNKRLAPHNRDADINPSLTQLHNKQSEQLQAKLRDILKRLGTLLPDSSRPLTSVQADCSITSQTDSCELAIVRTVLNFEPSSVYWSLPHTNLTIVNKCPKPEPTPTDSQSPSNSESHTAEQASSQSVFAITPTYARYTQKVDLTSLCQTVMHVPNMIWIVIEDSNEKTSLVTELLDRCRVTSVHLNVRTPPQYRPRPGADRYKDKYSRGVKQRNLGLTWIRDYCAKVRNCTGAVYFMDDDNKYDLRLFEEIKKTERVSVFPVGFSGGLKVEGPTCDENGKAVSWHAEWGPERPFPIDMAGFAIRVDLILASPDVWVGFEDSGEPTERGYLETNFLERFASRDTVECRSNNKDVLVWHVKTQKPWILFEANNPTDDQFEV